VLLTPRTRRAMTGAQLSALVRTALIRAGIEDETLDSLRRAAAQEGANRRLSEYALNRGSITRGEAAKLLSVTPQQAHGRLAALCTAGTLVRVGAKYYPAARAVAPEQQAETIRAYLTENGAAYRQDLAQLLGLGARVTARLLRGVCALVIALIVIGRLFAGVHWLTDVVGGVLYGAALLRLYAAAAFPEGVPAVEPEKK
jgi:hypothetical protein